MINSLQRTSPTELTVWQQPTPHTTRDLSHLVPTQAMRGALADPELQQFVNSLQELAHELEETGHGRDLEILFMQVCQSEIDNQKHGLGITAMHLNDVQREKYKLNEEFLQKLEDWHKSQKTTKWWSLFKTLAALFQTLSVGACAMATGGTAAPVIAFLVTLGLTLDSLQDDAGKKRLASIMSYGNKGCKEKWTIRLEWGATILGLAASMKVLPACGGKLAIQAQQYVRFASNFSQNAGTLGHAWCQVKTNQHEAKYLLLDQQGEQLTAQMKKDRDHAQKLSEAANQVFINMAQFNRQQHSCISRIVHQM